MYPLEITIIKKWYAVMWWYAKRNGMATEIQ